MVSALEQKEAPDADTLERIAALLKVPAEAISNFNEEAVTTIISTVVNNSDTSTGNSLFCYSPTINPLKNGWERWKKKKPVRSRKDKNEMIAILQQLVKK